MDRTVESKPIRTYCIQMQPETGGQWPPLVRICADVMCETHRAYIFKREDQIVGKIEGPIRGWWIEEER